jgi:hypothetical protein
MSSHLTESGICEMKFSKICALTGLLRSDGRGVDLISDALPFGRLWYGEQAQSTTQSNTRSFQPLP